MARHPLARVSVTAPEGWHDASVLSFIAPIDGGFRANVLVTQEPVKDADVDAFAERQNAELFTALSSYKRLSTAVTTVSGAKAVRVAYTFASGEGETVRQDVAYVMRDAVAYALVMTSDDRAHAKVAELFDRVLASFSID